MKLNADQKATLESLTADEKKAYEAMENDGERVEYLGLVATMRADAEAFDKELEESAEDFVLADSDEREKYIIYKTISSNPDVNKGLNTLKVGQRVVGEFLGTEPMFSLSEKENWNTITVKGKTVWVNKHYVFRNSAGVKFGVHHSPMLATLSKIPTRESAGPAIAQNPVVSIEYFGLIKGKEKLAKDFGFKPSQGAEAHGFKVTVGKATPFDKYARGVVNYLNNPIPNLTTEGERLDDVEQAQRNYERLQEIKNAGTTAQIEQ